jgi:septal ring factor EnvC (AmiA/AmiB activator)
VSTDLKQERPVGTRNEKIEKLAAKRREIGKEIDRMRAAQAQERRKHDARRKILVGAVVLAMVERG